MAYIKVVGQAEATGELAAAYEQVAGKRGKVSNVLAIQSLDPNALLSHLALYQAVMFSKEGLSRREREAAAVVVSAANQCAYCVAHHSAALAAHSSEEFAAELSRGEEPEGFTARERALAAFAMVNTLAPTADPEGVAELREAGLSDLEVLQAAQVVAYFNFVNRVVLTLGVSLEGDGGGEGYKH